MSFKNLVEKIKRDKKNVREYFRDDDNFNFEVANLITEARIHAGLTQEELANLINTKQSGIARWEAASSLPSLRTLKKIADALHTYLIPPKFGFMPDWQVQIHVQVVNTENISQSMPMISRETQPTFTEYKLTAPV